MSKRKNRVLIEKFDFPRDGPEKNVFLTPLFSKLKNFASSSISPEISKKSIFKKMFFLTFDPPQTDKPILFFLYNPPFSRGNTFLI